MGNFSSKVLRKSDGFVFNIMKQVIMFIRFKTENGRTSFVYFCNSLGFFLVVNSCVQVFIFWVVTFKSHQLVSGTTFEY